MTFAVFAESEIRSNITFQGSKIAQLLLGATAKAASMPPWQVIGQGICKGTLVEVNELTPEAISNVTRDNSNVIVAVKKASGDEELVSLGDKLKGVILLHEIPHLSHLGVRTRQEKLPFIASSDPDGQNLRDLYGHEIKVIAASDGVRLLKSGDPEFEAGITIESSSISEDPQICEPSTSRAIGFIELEAATLETAGSKALGCKELLYLAQECSDMISGGNGRGLNHPFRALNGIVIPFGCMEGTIEGNGKTAEWELLVSKLDACMSEEIIDQGELDNICKTIRSTIMGLNIPGTFLRMIDHYFKQDATLILRSSATVEDLKGLSGAGLYDSFNNISSNNHQSLENGIKQVWASLFSRRAVLARAAAKISSKYAQMAVLIQEQISPDVSFVIHTSHPLISDGDTSLIEIAPGQGETLASGTRGSGWRLTVNGTHIHTDSFANFSQGYIANSTSKLMKQSTIDYSKQELSCSEDARNTIGKRLKQIGDILHNVYGFPQDVEGCILNDIVYVLQTRPQPM